MSVVIYLVRHGETVWNREGRYQGHLDVPLEPVGREQVERLARRLAAVAFDRIVSSDLSRCLDTARAVRARQLRPPAPPPVEVDPRLREMAYGRWEGLTLADVRARFPEEAEAYRRDAVSTRIEGGESFADVMERTKTFTDELIRESGRVLVVTHGGTLKALLFNLLGLDPHLRGRIVIDNCSLTVVRAGEGARPRLLRMNDVAHLDLPLP